jgi:hypothetical protein
MTSHVRHLALSLYVVAMSFTNFAIASNIIHVPGDQPNIQAGINAASNGDTVLVAPGTYKENINFSGKAITVKSSGGASVTIIDGGGLSSVVTFNSNETSGSVLSGFILQNGDATNGAEEGGGIQIEGASPTIQNNIIQNNKGINGGGGIGLGFASPLIENNIIRANTQDSRFSGGIGGGGISVRGASTAQIVGNTIQSNTWPTAFGGGISLFGAGAVLIKNDVFIGNTCFDSGNGIAMANDVSGTVIVQNVFTGNNSTNGSTIFWWNSPAALVNNTITDGPTSTPSFSLVTATGLSTSIVVANNVLAATNVGTMAWYCVDGNFSNPSNFNNNDVFSKQGTAYGGLCTSQTGSHGNISANPTFVSKGNLRLKGGSLAIDVGNNSAPDLPNTDLVGNLRIINGNDLPSAVVDMGAYEFVPVILSPKSLKFGVHPVGSSTSKNVTLGNKQSRTVTITSYSVPTGYSVTGCGSSVAAFSSCTLTVTFQPLTGGTYNGTLAVTDDAGNSPQTVILSGSAQ